MAMTLISTVTIGSGGATSIDFNSIPQTYTDLVLITAIRNGTGATASGGRVFKALLNGSSSSRTIKYLNGAGNAIYAGNLDYFWVNGSTDESNAFGNTQIYIPNYAGAQNKVMSIDSVGETNGTTAEMSLTAVSWANTAAITSISISATVLGNVAQYSTASLYGILKA